MISLRDAISILFKRKAVICLFFLSLVAGAFLALKITPPTYAAASKILVKIGREDIYTPSIASDAFVSPMISVIREEQLNSEVQIIMSDNLVEKLVEEMGPEGMYPGMLKVHPWYTPKGIMQRLIGVYKSVEGYFAPLSANPSPEQRALKRFLRKDLRVGGTGDSNVIEVTVKSKIPQLAADISNKIVDLYMVERTRIHSDSEGKVFEMQMQEIENRLQAAEAGYKAFRETHKMHEDEAERRRLEQDLEIIKKSRQLYLEKVEEYKINTALSSARIGNVSVISRAIPPSSPASPKIWLVMLAVLGVGLAGGAGLAFLAEFLDDSIETDSDVQKYLGLPVLGKIGYIS